MLERVMRRFGVTGQNQERPPTYLEELLPQVQTRVRKALLKNRASDPLVVVARESVLFESKRQGWKKPTFTDDSINDAALAFFNLLADNDYLPPSCQLGGEEIQATWKLLHAYATSDDQTSLYFDEVLSLLEDKFNNGDYPQASLLLRLFETTPSRQRNNERTLFYEEMIARFGAQRVELLTRNQCKRYRQLFSEHESHAQRLFAAAKWLSEYAGVNFNLPIRLPADLAAWQDALEPSEDPALIEAALARIPPPRLRNLVELNGVDLTASFRTYVTTEHLFNHVSRLLKCGYFVVLVTGKTGFEPYIKYFFKWVERNFQFPGTRLLPELHKRTTVGEEGLDVTVQDIIAHKMVAQLPAILEAIEDTAIQTAIENLADDLEDIDPNDIPPGEYSLLGLLLDRVTHLQTTDPTVLLRIHRIC